MKPVVLLLIYASNLTAAAGLRLQGLPSSDKLGISLLGLRFAGEKIGANTSSLSVRLGMDEEELFSGKDVLLENGKQMNPTVGETLAWALVICFALTIGFRLGVRNGVSSPAFVQIRTPASNSSRSTATNSPPASYSTKHFLFDEFSLDDCPPSPLSPLSPLLFSTDSITEDCLETGRLKESFKDIHELWADGDERMLTGRHILEGKKYLLREKTVKSLKDLPTDALFRHTQSRLSLSSSHFLSYVTSWVESSHSSLRILTQVEFHSDQSLSALLIGGKRLTKTEAATVLRQVEKAVHFAESNKVRGYDFAPEKIYVDGHLKVKIADFDLKKPTNAGKSNKNALKAISELLGKFTSNE